MSPSKRAGDTVEPDVDSGAGGASTADSPASDGAPGPSGNGSGGRSGTGSTGARSVRPATPTRPKRRSTTAPAAATVTPERGSASQRGASSSSITRRSATGTPTAGRDDDPSHPTVTAPVAPVPLPAPVTPVAEEPATTADPSPAAGSPLQREPAPVESPVVESPIALPPTVPTARVEASTRRPADAVVVASVLPVVTPVGPAAQRGAQAGPPATVDEPVAPPDQPYVTTTMSSHQVAPVPRLVGRRPRVRKVTRVVRHVDPWSVFKVAVIFNLVLFGVLLTAGVLLWNVAYATGTIDNLERFFESFGWSEFEFDGGAIFHSGWVAGLFGVVGLTGAAVLAATLFNLITDLVGGIRMTVLEEEVVERTSSPMRRFVVRRPNGVGDDPGSEMRPEGSSLPARRDPVDDPFL